MSAPYLCVEGLTVAAGNSPLVRGVSFTAAQGRVTGLVGESGSGKSLTCQAIMGLSPRGLAVSGEIRLNGELVRMGGGEASRRARGSRAALIMQNPASCFDPVFTIRAHFRETLAAHRVARRENTPERWAASLREVGFAQPGEILDLYPFQMSGGMLQRVMIALALVLDAPYLLADEATTDLDAVSQLQILELLEWLVRNRKMGVLLVTHDLSVIARLADDVLVMRGGRIVERGPAARLFEQPGEAYTCSLMQAHFALYGRGQGENAA